MGRHDYGGELNSRGRRQNTKGTRGLPNVIDTRRLDELLDSERQQRGENDMSLTDTVRKILSPRAIVAPITDEITRLLGELAQLREERATLLSLKPPREEIIAEVNRQVDALAVAYARDHGPRILDAAAGRVETAPGRDNEVVGVRPGSLTAAFPGVLTLQDLIALAPDVVKASVAKILKGVEYEQGSPLSERVQQLADVDHRIAAIERAHTELADEARAAGPGLELLPEERARRYRAAQHADFVRKNNALNRDAIARGVAKPIA